MIRIFLSLLRPGTLSSLLLSRSYCDIMAVRRMFSSSYLQHEAPNASTFNSNALLSTTTLKPQQKNYTGLNLGFEHRSNPTSIAKFFHLTSFLFLCPKRAPCSSKTLLGYAFHNSQDRASSSTSPWLFQALSPQGSPVWTQTQGFQSGNAKHLSLKALACRLPCFGSLKTDLSGLLIGLFCGWFIPLMG